MRLNQTIENAYGHDGLRALEAQRKAQEIAFAPIAFQVSRLMCKFGILQYLSSNTQGSTFHNIKEHTGLSDYAVHVLMAASLFIGTVTVQNGLFYISKTGWFLINDRMAKVNMAFNHDVNYQGMFYLEESLLNGRPEGLKIFGDWPTVYEGLSSLPENIQKSWFDFDHFYSDESFPEALKIIFKDKGCVRKILDIGGNTGRWAMQCVKYDDDVEVTVLDLPQQLEIMKNRISGQKGAERIHGHSCDILKKDSPFPSSSYDIIWMSQFLDCFSEQQITDICRRAAGSMGPDSRLFVMETFWDRQKYETAAYCIALTSLYFTAIANGNSRMYHSADMIRCITDAGLQIEESIDNIGLGHTILICRK